MSGFFKGFSTSIDWGSGMGTTKPEPEKAKIVAVATTLSDFVRFMYPLEEQAVAKGYKRGIITAQVGLETANGRSVIDHNLFNIKCTDSWKNKGGKCVGILTKEEVGGVMVDTYAYFRKYSTYYESLNDYINLISGLSRYASAWSNRDNATAYFDGLLAGGYATDSNYVNKCVARFTQVVPLLYV